MNNSLRKTTIFTSLMITLFMFSTWALKIDKNEITKVKPVNFINYRGNKKADPGYLIKRIGLGLADKLKNKGKYADWNYKYSIFRAHSESEKNLLSADIFIIRKNARVNHIYNVRRIAASYLQRKYQINYNDAYTIAKFITYYNAVYRSNIDYFSKKYKKVVMDKINKSNAGIALYYKKWPGNTRMLIPLVANSKLDTNTITDKKVIDELKKKENRGVDDRKKIVDIKKKEVEKEKEKLDEKKKKIDNDEKKIIDKKEEIEKEKEKNENRKKELEKKKEEIKKKKEEINKIDDEKKKEDEKKKLEEEKKKLDDEKKDLEKKEEETKKKEDELNKKEDELENKKEENKEEEKELEKKEDDIKKEEKEIKKDEKINEFKKDPDKVIDELEKKEKELDKERDSILEGKLYYLKVNQWLKDGHYDNDMLIIDPANAKVKLKSPVRGIDGRKYELTDKGVLVIVHNQNKPNEHNLVLLGKDKLELLKKGTVNIFWRSFIELRDDKIYAMINENDQYYLGRFNTDLRLETKSKIVLDEDTFISFFNDFIYLNRKDKTVIVLKKQDLSFLNEVKP